MKAKAKAVKLTREQKITLLKIIEAGEITPETYQAAGMEEAHALFFPAVDFTGVLNNIIDYEE